MARPGVQKHASYYICGFPLVEKIAWQETYRDDRGIASRGSSDTPKSESLRPPYKQQAPESNSVEGRRSSDSESNAFKAFLNSAHAIPTILIVGAILMLPLAYCTFQYIAITNCPEKINLDNTNQALQQCEQSLHDTERAKNTAEKNNEKLDKEIKKITEERLEFERKLEIAENDLKALKTELELAKQQGEKSKEDMGKLSSEKDVIDADLKATRYNLGNCKNKNMDHEVQSLELLQEIEGLKKELKAC